MQYILSDFTLLRTVPGNVILDLMPVDDLNDLIGYRPEFFRDNESMVFNRLAECIVNFPVVFDPSVLLDVSPEVLVFLPL